jgi:uncharacterized protein
MADDASLRGGVTTRPDPIVTVDSSAFWAGADRGELIIQQCGDCTTFYHPPRPMCPKCHTTAMRPVKANGRGTIYSYCIPIHPPSFGFAAPPIVALIDLEEGVRIVSNVVGIEYEKVTNGLKVEVEFEPTEGGHQVPVFRVTTKKKAR